MSYVASEVDAFMVLDTLPYMCSSGYYTLSLGLYVYVPPTIYYQPSGDLLPLPSVG